MGRTRGGRARIASLRDRQGHRDGGTLYTASSRSKDSTWIPAVHCGGRFNWVGGVESTCTVEGGVTVPKRTKIKWGEGFDDFFKVMEEGRQAAVEAGAVMFGTTDIKIKTDPSGTAGRILNHPSVTCHEHILDVEGEVK